MSGALQTVYQNLRSFGAGNDAYFKYNSLLLSGNGTNNANNNTFLDSSTNAFAVTRVGNTTQGTFSPYGANWSNYFTNNILGCGNSALIAGTNTFTIEFWIYLNSINSGGGNNQTFIDTRSSNSADSTAWLIGVINSTNLKWFTGTSDTNLGGTLPYGQWVHVAYTRNASNVITAYINGVATGTTTTDSRNLTNTNFWIGGNVSNIAPLDGYFSNVRWVVGTVVYTGNFTPSTTPLTAITNTKLLTCQSNRFVDNSVNNVSISLTGSPTVQRFSPFSPSNPGYTSAVYGGSGYFDGTGDYLSAGSSSAFAVGTGDFTFQVYVYPLAYTNPVAAIFETGSSVVSGRFCVVLYANGLLRVDNNTNLLTSSSALPLNQWTFISIIRSSGTMTMYFNATSVASGSITNNFSETQGLIGKTVDNYHFTGYISNLMLVKGTALANTVPTAPLTAITNTSLLLNMTSAGIVDNSMINNLETVGDAKISTAQSKFGGSSMYFDGTGDYLTIPSTVNLNFGTADFTIEMWAYFNSLASYPELFSKRGATGWFMEASSTILYFGYGVSGSQHMYPSVTLTTSTWYHIAATRVGSTLSVFLNGVKYTATVSNANLSYDNATAVCIGRSSSGGYELNGYIDDLRITKGYARYTANFTPPTSAFPTF